MEYFFNIYWLFNFYKVNPPFPSLKHAGYIILHAHLSEFAKVFLHVLFNTMQHFCPRCD